MSNTDTPCPAMPVGDRPGSGEKFPMSIFEPHEKQAERNHYQSLETLARRGGLSWCEALAILEDRDWRKIEDAEAKFRAAIAQPSLEVQTDGRVERVAKERDYLAGMEKAACETVDFAQAKLDAANATIEALQRSNAEKDEALRKARNKFLHYEQLHRLKCTSEGDEKADRNREMADMLDKALSHETSNG